MQIVKATPHCGAEVRGIDLSRPLADADAAALQHVIYGAALWLDRTRLAMAQRLAFRRRKSVHEDPVRAVRREIGKRRFVEPRRKGSFQ
jgi:alpha-ketoglutarate-dependent taurine dioxygenase